MVDYPNYPLQRGMSLAEIKAVEPKAIVKACMGIAEIIANNYVGTEFYVNMKLTKKILQFITMLKHTGGSLGGVKFRLLPFQAEFVIESLCVLYIEFQERMVKLNWVLLLTWL